MEATEIIEDAELRMDKAIEVLKKNLSGIRTGRANPGLVDSLRVDVYGSPTPIKQVAQVGAPEPTQIVIRPYDASIIKEIEKAIVSSDLGFNPQNDGRMIRLNVPPLSTEVRKKMVSRIKELSEDAKISIFDRQSRWKSLPQNWMEGRNGRPTANSTPGSLSFGFGFPPAI